MTLFVWSVVLLIGLGFAAVHIGGQIEKVSRQLQRIDDRLDSIQELQKSDTTDVVLCDDVRDIRRTLSGGFVALIALASQVHDVGKEKLLDEKQFRPAHEILATLRGVAEILDDERRLSLPS